MSWQPILDGELADLAWKSLRAIADGLATYDQPVEDLALFWSYVAPALGDAYDTHHETALGRLGSALDRGLSGPGLYNGLAGLGWTIAHCSEGAEELLQLIDGQLLDALRSHDVWPGPYDLIGGLAGIAVYFFERGDTAAAHAGLQAITHQFARLAKHTGERVTWHTPVDLIPIHERERNPDGWYNCGVAHGVPGVIAILGKLHDPSPEVIQLRDGAIRWLSAQHTPDASQSRFPRVARIDHTSSARTAWCYGDPGIVAVLWDTLHRTGRDTHAIEELALTVLSRPIERTSVIDAALCHGAVGLAHIANRFYQATANGRFRDLARYWYAACLDFARPGTGIGGFSSWGGRSLETQGFFAVPDFLDGAAGLGLALAAALTPIDPDWDRLLLLDLAVKS